MRRWLLAVGVVVALASVPVFLWSSAARAEGTRSAVCTPKVALEKNSPSLQVGSDGVQAWMNDQLGQGRTSFVVVPNPNNGTQAVLCAW